MPQLNLRSNAGALVSGLALVVIGLLLALLPARDLGALTSHQFGLISLVAGTIGVAISSFKLAGHVDWGEMPGHW